MKTSIYVAVLSIVATAITTVPVNAAPANNMLTTSGPPPAFRSTRNLQSNELTDMPNITADNTKSESKSCPSTLRPATTGEAIRQQLEMRAKCQEASQPAISQTAQ
jgi:hypothetical protein